MDKPEPNKLLTVKETAELMRVSERTVFNYMKLERLKPLRARDGGALRFLRSEVLQAMSNSLQESYSKRDPSMG